jgi:hypothetical protein
MGSRYPKTSFVESELAQLEWVLESVWVALGKTDESVKATIRRKLFLLACNGINDPDILRDRLVASAAEIEKRRRSDPYSSPTP